MPKRYLCALFLLLLVFATTGCGQVTSDPNYTLAEGRTVSGPLFLFSQNALLEKESRVEGPVIMLCCNLIVDGSVTGDVLLVSGNIRIDAHAVVGGVVNVISGNVAR